MCCKNNEEMKTNEQKIERAKQKNKYTEIDKATLFIYGFETLYPKLVDLKIC